MAKKDPADHLPLSTKIFHIMLAVAEGPMNGYQVMTRVEENSGGLVRIGPGTLYETLHKLASQGLINESGARKVAKNGRGQRYYETTAFGRKVLAAESQRLATDLRIARRVGAVGR